MGFEPTDVGTCYGVKKYVPPEINFNCGTCGEIPYGGKCCNNGITLELENRNGKCCHIIAKNGECCYKDTSCKQTTADQMCCNGRLVPASTNCTPGV